MASRIRACALGAAGVWLLAGCSSPFDAPRDHDRPLARLQAEGVDRVTASAFRVSEDADAPPAPTPGPDAGADDYVRYALFHSPRVEGAYQRWVAASERPAQAAALPDPRLNFGFFLDEVETRVGPQQARIGVQQTIPWPGKLSDRADAADRAAAAAWHRFESARLEVTERVVTTLHELAYLDAATRITGENLELLRSFEEVVRARYRVGAGSHPELIRVQVELGQLEDRVAQLHAMRPAYVAELNAALNRGANTPVPELAPLPARVANVDADRLGELARRSNPALLALDEQAEEHRHLTDAARKDGLPDLTVGLDYTVTGEARQLPSPRAATTPSYLLRHQPADSGEKYDAGGKYESIARRLAITHDRTDEANRLDAGVHRAWFEHTDADRRLRLYERTLIPKAQESLRASLAGFRTGDTSFLDLLDTERSLLEFALAAERARADRGEALARLTTLVGEPIPTRDPDTDTPTTEARP
ncbi:MAG: TolC family protein [Phycisphaerales bacterium]